jgi:hypothetical protein
MIDGKGRRGAALAVVFTLGMVLFLLVGAAFVLFKANTDSFGHSRRRTRALRAAESGAMLAMHVLAAEPDLLASGAVFALPMDGDSAGWIPIPGTGDRALVMVDPSNASGGMENGLVEIRSRGRSAGQTRDVVIRAAEDFPSRYILLCDGGTPRGLLSDGYYLDGPLHCNGAIHFSSATPDSSGDPYVARASTTEEGGFHFSDCGRADSPHPEGSAVWVRPYSTLRQGRPFWTDQADSVSFEILRERFGRVFLDPPTGSVRIGGGRMIIDGDLAYLKRAETMPAETLDIRGVPLLIQDTGMSPLYVKTSRRPDRALTILARGDIYIYGQVDGPTVSSGGPLALVTMGDLVIAEDPELAGRQDWPEPWDVETDRNLSVRAVLAAPQGKLRARNPGLPRQAARLTITGSLTQRDFGRTGSAARGYDLRLAYDRGLSGRHPPGFPPLGRWTMLSWRQDAEYGDEEIDDDMF